MDIRNLFLILWLSTIAGIVSGAILVVYGEPTFPAAPMGMCMDGVDILDGQYPNSSIVYAYDPYPAPGHAWIILNGSTPVDPYYGVEDATYEWLHPQHTFTTFAELQAGAHAFDPATGRITEGFNSLQLDLKTMGRHGKMADEFVVISEVDGLQMIEYLDDDAEWSAWAVAEERANRELGKCEEAIALEEEAA